MFRQSQLARRLAVVLLGAVLVGALGAPAASAAPVHSDYGAAAQKAAAWIAGQQQPDGSFPGFGVGSTADAIYGLVAGGQPGNPAKAGTAALDYLAAQAAGYAKTPGAAAKLVLAITATGATRDLHNFGGVDLLNVITSGYDAASGHYGKDVTGQALAILALTDAKQPVPPAAVAWLATAQGSEGGWAFDGSTGAGSADTNTTGLALQALAVAGNPDDAVTQKAVAYFHAQQNADGGFAYQKGGGNDSDANSTAMVIMGLTAAGENPASAAWQQKGVSPLDFLVGLQNADGALRYQAAQPDDNGGATYQAVPALAGRVLPVEVPVAVPIAVPTPGMPTTGAGADPTWPLLALLAALCLIAAGRRLASPTRAHE